MSEIVLGIDTATRVNVGLARNGEVLAEASVEGNRHVEDLTPLVARVLAEAGLALSDVTLVAVGLGPGPFTGLRVGIATARVLASVLGVPLRGVCTLDVVAAEHRDVAREFVAAIDARRKELYWARYVDGVRVEGPCVTAPGELPAVPVLGPGAGLYPAATGDRALDAEPLTPGALARHATGLPDEGVEPLYLRRPDATEPTRRKSALPASPEEIPR